MDELFTYHVTLKDRRKFSVLCRADTTIAAVVHELKKREVDVYKMSTIKDIKLIGSGAGAMAGKVNVEALA